MNSFKGEGPNRVRLVRPSFFIFAVVPLALLFTYQTYGLPHPIWSYAWIDQGQGYGPLKQRHYTRCTYLGPYGAFTDHRPADGTCHWFVMVKKKENGS